MNKFLKKKRVNKNWLSNQKLQIEKQSTSDWVSKTWIQLFPSLHPAAADPEL